MGNSSGSFTQQIAINANKREVMAFISNLRNFMSLKPQIISIQLLPNKDDQMARYQFRERIKFLCFWMNISFSTDVVHQGESFLMLRSYPGYGILVESTFTLSSQQSSQNQCTLKQETKFTCCQLFYSKILNEINHEHPLVLKGIKKTIEQSSHKNNLQQMK